MIENSLDATLRHWLDEHAEAMDQQPGYAAEVLQQMAPHGLFELGLCERLGGRPDSSFRDALTALIAVAKHSLNAAFILWAQRGVIGLLARQPDHPLTQTLLPLLLSGRVAGAPGLSNLIKFGSGLEPLQVGAQPFQSGWELNGQLPWVSNAQQENFIDRKSTRLNSSHVAISYAVFCLKKKKQYNAKSDIQRNDSYS